MMRKKYCHAIRVSEEVSYQSLNYVLRDVVDRRDYGLGVCVDLFFMWKIRRGFDFGECNLNICMFVQPMVSSDP